MLPHRREVKEMPEPDPREQQEQFEKQVHELQTQVRFLEDEVSLLRRRLTNAPRQVKLLEDKLLEARSDLSRALSQNEKLAGTLQAEKERIEGSVSRAQPATGVVRGLPPTMTARSTMFTAGLRCV
jgi:proteasome-associated ATPase